MTSTLPKISHVLELCLYARHLPTSVAFYSQTLRLGRPFLDTPRMAGFSLGSTTLLLFQRGQTASDSVLSSGVIPGHGPPGIEEPTLKTHFALAVDQAEDVVAWERELRQRGVEITGTAQWPGGGRSVYFKDPDDHVGEVASRGIWPHY